MLHQSRFASFALMVFILSGCIPASRISLSDAGMDAVDRKLLGVWEWREGDERPNHVYVADNGEGEMVMTLISLTGNNSEVRFSAALARKADVGGHRFLSLRPVIEIKNNRRKQADDKQGKHWLLIRYAISDDGKTVEFRAPHIRAVRRAVRDRDLTSEGGGKTVVLTSDRETLKAYFAELRDDQFQPPVTYGKISR